MSLLRGQAFARRKSGQTMVETILVLPLFLLFVFGLLQIGQLAVTLVTVNYAAGSIARKAVQRGSTSPSSEDDNHFQQLLFGGMKPGPIVITQVNGGGGSVTQDLQVNACAQVNAFPFIGPFLRAALGSTLSTGAQCDGSSSSFYFGPANGSPYAFIVKGTARARMNYAPS